MYRLFLAVRYLWSRPISWVSMVGIWLSVMALIATFSIMTGFLRQTRAMIRGTTSDLIVSPEAPAGGLAPGFRPLMAAASRVDGAVAAAPRLLRPALIRVPTFSSDLLGNRKYAEMNFVQVVGIDPKLDGAATDLAAALGAASPDGDPPDDPARPFALDPRRIEPKYRNADLPVALVGEGLFDWYRLQKGQVITLVTLPGRVGADEVRPLSQRVHVGGSFRTGHYQHDRATVLLDLEAARQFAEAPDEVTEICVKAAPEKDLIDVKAGLEGAFAAAGLAARVETWGDRHRVFLGAVENERSILGFLLFFFVAVACFNVFATLTIMVSDKTKDIGVLNAMGATGRGLLEVFVGCGVIMTLSSAAAGCLSGVLVARHINHINDVLEWLLGVRIFRADIYTFAEIPVVVQPWFVAAVFLATLVFAVLCALLPALRAARMDPVAALRYE